MAITKLLSVSCETSCKLEHDLPVGPRFIRVMQVGPKKVGKHTKMLFYPMACFHCGHINPNHPYLKGHYAS